MNTITKDETMFALRSKTYKTLAGVCSSSNGDDAEGTDVEFSLDRRQDYRWGSSIWCVNDRAVAEKAAVTSCAWYNATYETPKNEYIGDWEVVELVLK